MRHAPLVADASTVLTRPAIRSSTNPPAFPSIASIEVGELRSQQARPHRPVAAWRSWMAEAEAWAAGSKARCPT
ncbi:MAG: hypothetical protein P8Z30_20685, partial [Acidobacteriota bacterium]